MTDKHLSIEEVVELGAVDSEFFCRYFFPNTMRQGSADFHTAIWKLLDSNNRFINIQVFRGGAKTSILRMYTAKRIAYGLAHTVLFLGKSEGHSIRSINWIKRHIEHNKLFKQVFGLRQGNKWQDIECEIWHGTDEYPIWLMGMGITGSVRGINRDDFRPDLIVVDDVIDEENAATPDQRLKITNLLYGAVKQSLTPATESPDAKLVMLQTPLNKEDPSTLALTDAEWKSAVFGCWTPATADLIASKQESSWAVRYPSETLREEKVKAAARNRLSIWVRENECKLTSPETSAFRAEWLKFYSLEPDPVRTVLVVDPVPPPSDIQIAKGLRGKDYEAFAVVGRAGADYYLLDYTLNRGHDPSWSVAEFLRLAARWNPLRVYVEATAYQRTLAWLFRKAMEHQRKWYVIEEFDDKRKKYDRIVDALNGISANGHMFVKESHTDFITQFRDYPDIVHDDLIDAVSVGVTALQSPAYDVAAAQAIMEEQDDIPALEYAFGAP